MRIGSVRFEVNANSLGAVPNVGFVHRWASIDPKAGLTRYHWSWKRVPRPDVDDTWRLCVDVLAWLNVWTIFIIVWSMAFVWFDSWIDSVNASRCPSDVRDHTPKMVPGTDRGVVSKTDPRLTGNDYQP